jgi:hypothetical protein
MSFEKIQSPDFYALDAPKNPSNRVAAEPTHRVTFEEGGTDRRTEKTTTGGRVRAEEWR